MDIINQEKKYPTLVEVVNNSSNPTQVVVANLPLTANGSASYVTIYGSVPSSQGFRPTANNFNVSLDNILLLQSDGGFFAVPLNTFLTNVTSANLTNALLSYKTAYATLVSGVAAATLHYSKMTTSGVVTSEVYNLKE